MCVCMTQLEFQHQFLKSLSLLLLRVTDALWFMVYPSVQDFSNILTISVNISTPRVMFRKLKRLDSGLILLFQKHELGLYYLKWKIVFFPGEWNFHMALIIFFKYLSMF